MLLIETKNAGNAIWKKYLKPGNSFLRYLDISFELIAHESPANRTSGWLLKKFSYLAVAHRTEINNGLLAGTAEFTSLYSRHSIPVLVAGVEY